MSDLSALQRALAPGATVAGRLLDAMAVPAWLHQPGMPLRANAALLRLCGRDAGTAPGQVGPDGHLDLVADDDRAALAAATADCLQGSGEPPAQSLSLLGSDGRPRPVELTLRRVNLDGGDAVLVTCVDHSDFMHVQTMLQGMSGLLRQIIDGAPAASFVVDANHRVTHWNSACERLTGRSAEQMIGSTEAWRAFHDQPRAMLADLIIAGLDPAQLAEMCGQPAGRPSALVPGALEEELFFPAMGGGEGRWINFTAAPLRDVAGQVAGAIVTLQDVSQRRRTEEELTRRIEALVEERSAELAASARAMDAFIDNAPIGVVYADHDNVLRSNRRMAEIFGDANGEERQDFHLGPADLAELRRVATPALSQGLPLHHEMWLHHRSGRPIWTQVNAYRVDPQGPSTCAWWMLQDRTEVRDAEAALHSRYEELQATHRQLEQTQNQLLQSDKMASIGQLAAGVAHEINNPVGFVSSNLHTLRQYVDTLLALAEAQVAARAAPDDAAAGRRVDELLAAAELDYLKVDLPALLDESADGLARVKKIVQDLKDFSRVDQADWQHADLNAGLESTLNVVRHEVKYKAEVVRQLAPLPSVLCLAGQLNQVFMNLIVNASHAIADRGVITLSSGDQGDWVWVQVDDDGCGMTEEVSRRIFEPFYTTKDVGKGTGLGLSLSFSIVQRHGGAIRVRSAPGRGSSFRVWVPVGGPESVAGRLPPEWSA